ncbi:acyl-CoA dehydrogenase family protein [Mycobacterium sp. 852002-30065_SCH5024008]|uniref:acyl-CoA dehydrogenase family protein n=1 Tax=Mycobacterium sp. 852002-30065_SCH5024008 TaxID=1834088 RepID=UPI00080065EE|nr:acyl-CoA dehydrogenase family protein [Mycobacterium sp. 852002-30065_SCH5024008]OBB88434.1 acyl-CoA dehydrogenase [Mycobacterium sp. 852002-30065_SCH5024008]
MLLELDNDQRFWRDTVREAVDKQCPPALVRQIAEGRANADDLWRWYRDQGWTELSDPDNLIELILVLEELGRVTDPTPFLASLTQFAPLVGDRYDPAGSGTAVWGGVTTRRARDGWLLDGVARFVLDGDRADRLAITTASGVFIVDASQVVARRLATFDPVLHVADLWFDGVRVAEDDRVVGDRERALQVALTAMAITTVGACQRILDLTLDHLKQRKQFGVVIGSFQALQHKAVDMYVAVERARALAYFSALTIAAHDPRRRLLARMAKAAAGEAQSQVVRHGMQCFGAMSLTWENDLQFAIKRARAGELLLGSAEEHRTFVAKEYGAADF